MILRKNQVVQILSQSDTLTEFDSKLSDLIVVEKSADSEFAAYPDSWTVDVKQTLGMRPLFQAAKEAVESLQDSAEFAPIAEYLQAVNKNGTILAESGKISLPGFVGTSNNGTRARGTKITGTREIGSEDWTDHDNTRDAIEYHGIDANGNGMSTNAAESKLRSANVECRVVPV